MGDEQALLKAWTDAESDRRAFAAELLGEADAPGDVLDLAALKRFAKLDKRAKAAREEWYAHVKRRDK